MKILKRWELCTGCGRSIYEGNDWTVDVRGGIYHTECWKQRSKRLMKSFYEETG